MSLLRVQGIGKSFRGLKAVDDASFDVAQGAVVAMIGPKSVPSPPMIGPRMI